MTKALHEMAVEEVAPLIETKQVSPVEVVRDVFRQVRKKNETLNVYLEITREEAMERAKIAEKEIMNGRYLGMYHGIPLSIKDNIYFKGRGATMGSKIHEFFVSDFDATVVRKLKQAGANFTGKVNMHEYAWGITTNNPHFGPCRNPWDTSRIPGGSSGGSGVAVAADMCMASLGTDTAGSIRIPASACGIVGLKPTHGLVSKYGCFPLSWSLDHIGPMTKTVRDAAGLLEILVGFDPLDPTSVHAPFVDYQKGLTGQLKNLVIGVDEDYFFHNIDPEIDNIVRRGIQQLEDAGAKVKPINVRSLRYAEYSEMITILSEAATIHQKNLKERPEDFGEDIKPLLALGQLPSAVDYLEAQQLRRKIKQEFAEAFQKVDVFISPTLPIVPPKIGKEVIELNGKETDIVTQMIRMTGPANLTGLPALSVPCGFADGLPVGMQLMGPAFSEALLLNVGYVFEKVSDMKNRKPVMNH